MKATRNNSSAMNGTMIEDINITERNILVTALFELKEKHLNIDSSYSKILVKESTIMINEILECMKRDM